MKTNYTIEDNSLRVVMGLIAPRDVVTREDLISELVCLRRDWEEEENKEVLENILSQAREIIERDNYPLVFDDPDEQLQAEEEMRKQ